MAAVPNRPAGQMTLDSQPCLEFNHLVRHAKGLTIDSGGLAEETAELATPCVTLRDGTAQPETVTVGTNQRIGTDPAALKPALGKPFAAQRMKSAFPNGGAAARAGALRPCWTNCWPETVKTATANA